MYAELHCHSHYSLLDGASAPEALVARAVELGLPALALTDHDGLYGAVAFWRAARERGIQPIIGAELTLAHGSHLTLLAENQTGYANLSRLISRGQLAGSKGHPLLTIEEVAQHTAGLLCLTGCRRGAVAQAVLGRRPVRAGRAAGKLADIFGRERVWVELQRHWLPETPGSSGAGRGRPGRRTAASPQQRPLRHACRPAAARLLPRWRCCPSAPVARRRSRSAALHPAVPAAGATCFYADSEFRSAKCKACAANRWHSQVGLTRPLLRHGRSGGPCTRCELQLAIVDTSGRAASCAARWSRRSVADWAAPQTPRFCRWTCRRCAGLAAGRKRYWIEPATGLQLWLRPGTE